jgi:O-antigen ligase
MQEVLLLAWIASGVAVALVGVGQWLAGALVPAGSVGRAMGVYYSPNHMALYLERILPLPLALALCGWNAPGSMGIWRSPSSSAGRWRRVACMVTIVLAAGLYLTYSRGAWLLAVPVALSILGGLCWRQWRWWTAASVAIGLALALWGVLHGRAASSLAEEIRIPVWQSAVAMIADRPWRGVGLDGFQFVYPRYMRAEAWAEPLLYHPHNVWLDAAVRLGLPGTAVFLALVGSCLWGIGRPLPRASAWQQAIRAGLLAGLGAGLAHGMVDSGYFIGDLAWSLALAAGIGPALSRSHEPVEGAAEGSVHPGSRCDSHS